jgi:ribosomal-protein-serine acetyltransferase
MKVNVDDLYVVPANPNLSMAYAKAVRESKDHILDWFDLEDHVNSPLLAQSVYLHELSCRPDRYPALFVCTEEEVLACFQLDVATDHVGAEASGWIRKGYEGEGLGGELLKLICERAFVGIGHGYLVLHIDVDNIASNKTAEKAGFEFDHVIERPKVGRRGTGKMNVWSKLNNFPGTMSKWMWLYSDPDNPDPELEALGGMVPVPLSPLYRNMLGELGGELPQTIGQYLGIDS